MIRPFAPGELSNHRMPEWPILLTHSNMSRWSDLTSCTLHDCYRSRRAIDPLLALRHDSCLTFQCWYITQYFGVIGQKSVLAVRSEEHTSELQSLMRISYAVFCLKTKQRKN